MFRNYLTIAFRNLIRHKVYTTINALGLAMGIAFCLLTFLFIKHEWTYDQFHQDADRIYRVKITGNLAGQSRGDAHVRLSDKVGETLAKDLPQLKYVVRIRDDQVATLSHNTQTFEEKSIFADPDFFQLFTFPLIQGNPKTVLTDPQSLVLTQSLANKYFGTQNPIGQEITVQHPLWKNKEHTFVVKGIAQDPPGNTSIHFDLIMPHAAIPEIKPQLGMTRKFKINASDAANARPGKMVIKHISTAPPPTLAVGKSVIYVKPSNQVQIADLTTGLNAFVTSHKGSSKQEIQLHLQPIPQVHFDQTITNGLSAPSNPTYSYILAGIALAVLLIACINFVNLSFARSATRAREVGVRKVVGAKRLQIMHQFWSESLLLTAVAFVLGIMLTEFFLPIFNTLTQVPVILSYYPTTTLTLFGIGLFLFIGLGAGIYPALILSGFDPIAILKNRLQLGGKSWSGRFLVMSQFTMAILFLIATLVMSEQLAFLKNKNLGLNESQIVVIKTNGLKSGTQNRKQLLQTFKQELKRHTHITNVTQSGLFSKLSPTEEKKIGTVKLSNGLEVGIVRMNADYDFFSTLGIDILNGRNFSPDMSADESQSVLVNETLVEQVQLDDPLAVSLKTTMMRLVASQDKNDQPTVLRIKDPNIIGVVKDFHVQSLYYGIPPMAIFLRPEGDGNDFLVRIRPENISETLTFMATQWQNMAGDVPLEYSFLDESFDRLYQQEERWGTIVQYSSFFALFVACLGVLGLTALAITRRTKEIGIRKVLGASSHHIVTLLSKEFMLLILIANALAWPVAYYAANRWLQDFAFRINLEISLFLLGGALVFLTAIFTIGLQALLAAQKNPVDALRYE